MFNQEEIMFNQEEIKTILELLTIEQSKYAQKGQDDIVSKYEVIKQKIVRLFFQYFIK